MTVQVTTDDSSIDSAASALTQMLELRRHDAIQNLGLDGAPSVECLLAASIQVLGMGSNAENVGRKAWLCKLA